MLCRGKCKGFCATKRELVKSIKSKMLVFAVLSTLIPSVTLGLLSYFHNERIIKDKAAQELQSLAGFMGREIDLWLKERIHDIRVFSNSYVILESLLTLGSADGHERQPVKNLQEIRAASRQNVKVYLQTLQEKFNHYEQLCVLNKNAEVVASSLEQMSELHLPADWLQQATADGVVISDPYWQKARQRIVITIAVPIVSDQDQFLGALAVELNFHTMKENLIRTNKVPADEVILITNEGRVIFSSDIAPSELRTQRLPFETTGSLLEQSGRLVEYQNYRDTPVFGVLNQLQDLALAIVAEKDREDVYRELINLRNLFLVLISMLLFIVGLVAYFFGLSIVRPLNRLISAAGKVSAGDLDVDLPAVHNDELGYMTNVFNKMVAQIRRNQDEIRSVNKILYEKNQLLEELSITDSLTGLHNRKNLMEILSHQIDQYKRNYRSFTLLMLDLDYFKKLNDAYGHLAGDQALIKVADILLQSIRSVDYAARYGGEEFLIILFETSQRHALETAERIRARVAAEPFRTDGEKVTITISTGIAEVAETDNHPTSIIARADRALYQAKRKGRNRVCFLDHNFLDHNRITDQVED